MQPLRLEKNDPSSKIVEVFLGRLFLLFVAWNRERRQCPSFNSRQILPYGCHGHRLRTHSTSVNCPTGRKQAFVQVQLSMRFRGSGGERVWLSTCATRIKNEETLPVFVGCKRPRHLLETTFGTPRRRALRWSSLPAA